MTLPTVTRMSPVAQLTSCVSTCLYAPTKHDLCMYDVTAMLWGLACSGQPVGADA